MSDDFYKELSFLQLFKEFKKTTIERKEYSEALKHGEFRPENYQAIERFIQRLDDKLAVMINRFEDYFRKYGIAEMNLQKGIETLM